MKLQNILFPTIPCPPDLDTISHRERYQCQPLHVRVWRCRKYLKVPYRAMMLWKDSLNDYTFSECWDICVGLAQHRMKYYYTMSETFGDWSEFNENQLADSEDASS